MSWRTKSIEAALPYLYLKGISSGDFSGVMAVLLGKDAVGFSADTVLRLRQQWKEDLHQWDKRRGAVAKICLGSSGVVLIL